MGSSGWTIAPYTGIHFRVNALARAKGEIEYQNMTISETADLFDSDMFYRFQAGWQIGVNFDYKKLDFGVGYSLDFNDYAEDSRSRNPYVRIGVKF